MTGVVTEVRGPEPPTPIGLPMPRDLEMVFDQSRRVRVTTRSGRRFPFPVPNGWFIVAESAELAPGEVKALHYFGQDLVLFRTTSGKPRLLDAYCAHLGAHLAVGGKVEDECIRCPFHGFKYDGDSGQCVEIPYAGTTRIPARAAQRAYPTLERNQMIWAWHHADAGEPFYDVPEVAEFTDADWSDIVVRDFRIAVSCQDMAENNVDFAHFQFVHGTPSIPEDNFVTEGTYKRTEGMDGNFIREGYGLGLGLLRVKDFVTFLSSTTPVDEENVHVRWVFTAPKSAGEESAMQAADDFVAGVSQDIPIWENKIYRPLPVLTKNEAGIIAHRNWSKQFYSDDVAL